MGLSIGKNKEESWTSISAYMITWASIHKLGGATLKDKITLVYFVQSLISMEMSVTK